MRQVPQLSATPRIRELIPLLWSRLGSSRTLFVLAILLCLTDLVIHLLIPMMMEFYFNFLETGELDKVRNLLIGFNIGLLVLTVLGLIGHYLKQNNMSILHRNVALDLADHAQRLPLEKAQASHSADLQQRIYWDSNKVTLLPVTIFNNMGTQVLMLLFACIYMFTLQWQVALGVILLMPLCLLGSHLLRHRLMNIGKRVADQESVLKQCQQDALQSMDMLRAFDAQEWMTDRFVHEREKLNDLYMRRMWWQALVQSLSVTSALLIAWGTILVVAWLAVEGKIHIGALMAFFILIWRVYNPLLALGQLWGQIQESKGAAIRIASIWNAEKEPEHNGETNRSTDGQEASLTWHNVQFGYDEHAGIQEAEKRSLSDERASSPLLLDEFKLALRPASFMAIVGSSGSGKSTVAKLGAGLLFPTSGTVKVCGAATVESAEQARQYVSYVPQRPYLYAGSIRDNLLMAKPDATEAELIEAAMIAEAHSFIQALPEGYHTVMSEHGNSLSGGQKQRLAIARAVLADRPVWIFDEATSALDLETERKVMEAILKRAKERGSSVLVIAHRLTTVQEADTIVAMENGAIVEAGTHAELLHLEEGLYRSLWQQMDGSRAALHTA
ncbi:ABC transporter ATP-binding protein [Paenibacillus sp. 1011MAR3C5]|uniref:ABC transporter ATP-binding protein n=1 Tax=Paenibacillus sp. 1011MAR3C5 TaxID=1675787 RepID=UPI000E6CCBC6|nr:ABC transporter ATP-binding protein [Paenibacillus sp. 1011MAR3C5]RJE88508.1 ABC transporter ATP-binding protein [Paenibacillus sp. 1011MAR3C5]